MANAKAVYYSLLSDQAIRIVKSHTRKKERDTGEEKRQDALPELSGPELKIGLG